MRDRRAISSAFHHYEYWDAISRVSLPTVHESEVGADGRHARRFTGDKCVLVRESARLQKMWAQRCIIHMLLTCVPLYLWPGLDRRMRDSFRSRTRSEELSWRCRDLRIDTNCNNGDATDSRTLDLQFAISFALISGRIAIVVFLNVLTCVSTRAA